MRNLAGVVALCVALIAAPIPAVGADGGPIIMGAGNISCGTWTQDQREDDVVVQRNRAWSLGYLSAANAFTQAAGASDGDLAQGVDRDGVFAWIDNYCAANPLDILQDATFALVVEMRGRQRK